MFNRSILFAITFVAFFFIAVAFLGAVDALPEPINEDTSEEPLAVEPTIAAPQYPEGPRRVVARSIGLDEKIETPPSTDIDVMDDALLRGAAHYPESASLNMEGTVLLFGHSSYLPIVRNQAYKAFNGIQKLKEGEVVSVYSDSAEYRYRVTSIRLADASEDVVELPPDGRHLVLVTCDSFGKKTDRFIVRAEYQGVYAL